MAYSPWGCKELDMIEHALVCVHPPTHTHTHTHTHTRNEMRKTSKENRRDQTAGLLSSDVPCLLGFWSSGEAAPGKLSIGLG